MSYIILTNIVAVMVVLGVMILVHEWGHFIAAKWFGVRVDVFSIGFGKRLWGWRRGDTDYRVSMLPLGGYVKMAGENPGEPRTGDPGEFLAKPRWQRFIIALMGPAMNVVLAIVLLTGLYMVKYEKPAYQERLAEIGHVEEGSAADKAGLRPGDLIVRLGELENPTWEAAEIEAITSPDQPLEVVARREAEIFRTTITPEVHPRHRVGIAGWGPRLPAIVKRIEPGYPAEKAGLLPGDRVAAVNGEPLTFWPRLPELVQESEGQPLALTIQRQGQTLPVEVAAVFGPVPGGKQMWRIGIELKNDMIERRLSFPAALRESVTANKKFTLLIFGLLGKMLERKMSPRTLEGPIGIARLSGEAARRGFPQLINLMAAISLNLGILNLFPIPILDGGVILLLAIEGLMRRDLSLAVKERMVQVGFVFLVLIAGFVIYSDIVKLLPPGWEETLP